jgi:4a-hydroxytetrahydrobiopterin dehydratase
MPSELATKTCVPCKGGVPPLKGDELEILTKRLGSGWNAVDEHHLEKEFEFESFRENIAFVNKVANLAEQEGHHPNFEIDFKKTKILIWTHKIDGLTESDFILAAKIEEL